MTPHQRETVDAVLLATSDRLERVLETELARVGYARLIGRLCIGLVGERDLVRRARLEHARQWVTRRGP